MSQNLSSAVFVFVSLRVKTCKNSNCIAISREMAQRCRSAAIVVGEFTHDINFLICSLFRLCSHCPVLSAKSDSDVMFYL